MSNLTESMVRANQEYSRDKEKKKVKESKKRVSEAPDIFGLPTDDELDAEFNDIKTKFDQRRQDIETSRQSNIKDLVNEKAFIIDPQARLVYKDGPYYVYECPDDYLTSDEFESRMRKLRYNKVEPKYDETSRYEKDGITVEYYDDSPAKFSVIVPRKSVMSSGLHESKKKKVKESLDKFAYDETSEEDQGLFDWIGTVVADTIFSPTDFTDEENLVFDEAVDSLVKVYKSVEARKGNKVTESKSRRRVKESRTITYLDSLKETKDYLRSLSSSEVKVRTISAYSVSPFQVMSTEDCIKYLEYNLPEGETEVEGSKMTYRTRKYLPDDSYFRVNVEIEEVPSGELHESKSRRKVRESEDKPYVIRSTYYKANPYTAEYSKKSGKKTGYLGHMGRGWVAPENDNIMRFSSPDEAKAAAKRYVYAKYHPEVVTLDGSTDPISVYSPHKRVKEEITKDNYTVYRTCLDIVTDGSTPKIGPGSKFVNSLYRAVEDNGYALLNDSYSFDFEDVTDIYNEEDIDWILDESKKINEGYNSKLDPALDRVVTDYLKYKSQRKDLLGAGNTDKKSVKLKAELLDKKLKELRDEWKDLVSQMGSGYQEILSKTDKDEPSKTALKRIKELHQQSKKS